jgi:hypothetical protein
MKPGRHSDGAGLYLKVDQSGARRWVFLYERAGHQHEAGLGPINAVPLAKAREIAGTMRAQLAAGCEKQIGILPAPEASKESHAIARAGAGDVK